VTKGAATSGVLRQQSRQKAADPWNNRSRQGKPQSNPLASLLGFCEPASAFAGMFDLRHKNYGIASS